MGRVVKMILILFCCSSARSLQAKLCRITDHMERRDLEEHDHTRLVEFGCAAIDEFQAEGCFAAPGRSFDDDHVPTGGPAAQNWIEPWDTRSDQV